MHTPQSIGQAGMVLGLFVLALGPLSGCITSPATMEPTAKEVTSQDAHHPVKFGPAVSAAPLCGDSPKAMQHYSCSKGYSSY